MRESKEERDKRRRLWCKHFTGMMQPKCKAGVEYESVADKNKTDRYYHPCTEYCQCETTCQEYEPLTSVEWKADRKEIEESFSRTMDRIKNNICIVCNQPIKKVQCGRCVYGEPCGHRQYQGRC